MHVCQAYERLVCGGQDLESIVPEGRRLKADSEFMEHDLSIAVQLLRCLLAFSAAATFLV